MNIPFPTHWYALDGHSVSPATGALATPIFGGAASNTTFTRILDNRTREISWSSREAVETYLTNLGFVHVNDPVDPELWASSTPILVWRGFYDQLRVVEMRVLN